MRKTLYIHIGHYKSGTTALQVFFSQKSWLISRRGLAKAGIYYPELERNHGKHSAFAFSVLRAAGVTRQMYGYDRPDAPEALWSQLFETVLNARQDKVLISSEEFMRIAEFPNAEQILSRIFHHRPAGIDIKIIAYVREPGPQVASWHNQLIKMKFAVPDLEDALRYDIERIHYDYGHAFRPWRDMVGAENVIVRRYVRDSNKPVALHQDFMRIFGFELSAEEVPVSTDPNPRLDDRVTDLLRLMQNFGLPKPTLNTIRHRALQFLEAQDALVSAEGPGIEEVRNLASDGLEWLNRELGVAFAPELSKFMPEKSNVEGTHNLLLAFVYSELIQLRQRINHANIEELEDRVSQLEKIHSKYLDSE